MIAKWFSRLAALLAEHPVTTGGFLAGWAKLVTFASLFCGWSAAQGEAAQNLGNDISQMILALTAVYSVGRHAVEVARQLFVAPAGHVIVPTAETAALASAVQDPFGPARASTTVFAAKPRPEGD